MDSGGKATLIDIPDHASFYIVENKHIRANVFPLHYHCVNELFYILDGKGELVFNEARFSVKKSDIVIIRSNQDHAFIDEPGELLHLYCIYFADDALNYQQGDRMLTEFVQGLAVHNSIVLTQGNPYFYDIPRYFREIMFEQNHRTAETELLMRLLFAEMLVRIKRFANFDSSQSAALTSALSPTERAVLNVISYMEKNFYKNLLLKEMADMVPLGTRQFIRIFNKLTNKRFKEYLQELRINEALRLLSTHQKEIKSTCFEVGFEDLSHFYKVFRKYTGTTPKKYLMSLEPDSHTEEEN